jgi:hypothetical protein
MLVHVFEDLITQHPEVCFSFLEDTVGEEVEKAYTESDKLCIEGDSDRVRLNSAVLYKKLRDGSRKHTFPALFLLCQRYDTHEETSDILRGVLEEQGLATDEVPFFIAEGKIHVLTKIPQEQGCQHLVAAAKGKITLKPRREFAEALLKRLEEVAL